MRHRWMGAALLLAACGGSDEGGPAVTADAGADGAADGQAGGDADVSGSGVPDAGASDAADGAAADASEDAGEQDAAAPADAGGDADADGDADAGPAAVPLAADSPWPKFRHGPEQTGRAPHVPGDGLAAPWAFPTGKGIFSTPVIGGDGTIYVGSADRRFYALAPDGTERWSVETGEIIDSSALLDDRGRVYFGSGDGKVRALEAATGALVWTFEAEDPKDTGAFIRWFEGNVAMLPDGTLLAPNDNFRVYAIDRDTGTSPWSLTMPDQTWSLPAVDPATGRFFIGNNNLLPLLGQNFFAYDAAGAPLWSASSKGSIAASPLVQGGRVFAGGFDGWLRAYDAATGAEAWSLATRDHIYASPAALSDGTLIQPSADGTVYAVDPDDGAVLWAFDTREALRSSPAVDGEDTIYLGSGEGRLFVLRPDGTLAWSMQLIDDDRNDLNASPALGTDRVVIAGESGAVFAVPAGWCLRPEAAADDRCATGGEDLPADGAHVLFTTRFGALLDTPPPVETNEALAFTLLVREGGDTVLALIDEASLQVTTTPEVPLDVRVSPDRRFFVVIPQQGFPGVDFTLKVTGTWLEDPERDGLRMWGGTPAGTFDESFALEPVTIDGPLPPAVSPAYGQPGDTWELRRMAAPLPTLLPSYNQIGFDSLHYLVGLVHDGAAGPIGWVVGGKPGPGDDAVADPETRVLFPVRATADEGRITLENQDGFGFEVLSVSLAFDTFRVAGRIPAGAETSAVVDVRAVCGDIAFYGPFLRDLGL